MTDKQRPADCNFNFTLAQQMVALGCMDRSWHDHEHEQMKDLLCRGAAEIERLAKQEPDALAKAWEEGFQSAWVDGADRTSEHFVPNPYREK